MIIKELYRDFLMQLKRIYDSGEATTMTDWSFEKIAGIKRTDIIRDPLQTLNSSTSRKLNEALAQLLEHKPIQYVLEEAWFHGLKLKVNENVLIPRPETEELVELVISNNRPGVTTPVILDIGTGSGCIPIAIRKKLPAAKLIAVDISEKALAVAEENAMLHKTPINLIQLDFLDQSGWAALPLVDIIISNPPYIPLNEKEKMARNVLAYEPHTALFVSSLRPLVFYEKIAAFSETHLQPGGMIFLETHEDLAGDVAALFNRDGCEVQIKKDLFNKERMISIKT